MNFQQLNISKPLLKAIGESGYTEPTPIQEQAIPVVLQGRDLIGCAQTGTGKTAAFALPILQNLAANPAAKSIAIRTLILTPTRELALQINESFTQYGKHLNLKNSVIFGGVSQVPQVTALKRGVDILIATPGRLNDLIAQGHIHLGKIEIFVLDEADRMLDMGFIQDVKKIIKELPLKKQTLLFSATMPKEIMNLSKALLKDPIRVEVTPESTTVESIEQSLYFVEKAKKRILLAQILNQSQIDRALVFTRTKHGADRVVRDLTQNHIRALAIHGNKSQTARQTALKRFKDKEVRVLVATDIAARGIDIDELSHVFNFDLPEVPETYVHRIGRTGRAGLGGVAIAFCSPEEKGYLQQIEKKIGKQIKVLESTFFYEEEEILPEIARKPIPRPKHPAKAQPKKLDKAEKSQNRRIKKRVEEKKEDKAPLKQKMAEIADRQMEVPRSKRRRRNDTRPPNRIFQHEISVTDIAEKGGGYSRPSFYDPNKK